ncbi:hypothetical protein PMIN01_00264 [Paraphaeosphaeria minitans]|uniref:Uncharacterized protein n=1 Tax=Paraphaeosphaeria minitans TaxID=565426 RepID=A0A9P6KVU4_9PLEO|nr:hypothetical protein PMIN01_00264 [Paraphaeosphaeria minitans]
MRGSEAVRGARVVDYRWRRRSQENERLRGKKLQRWPWRREGAWARSRKREEALGEGGRKKAWLSRSQGSRSHRGRDWPLMLLGNEDDGLKLSTIDASTLQRLGTFHTSRCFIVACGSDGSWLLATHVGSHRGPPTHKHRDGDSDLDLNLCGLSSPLLYWHRLAEAAAVCSAGCMLSVQQWLEDSPRIPSLMRTTTLALRKLSGTLQGCSKLSKLGYGFFVLTDLRTDHLACQSCLSPSEHLVDASCS